MNLLGVGVATGVGKEAGVYCAHLRPSPPIFTPLCPSAPLSTPLFHRT